MAHRRPTQGWPRPAVTDTIDVWHPTRRWASGGWLAAVTDRQILAAYRLLAREEGVFVEMASAASVAGHQAANAR